MCYLRVTCVTVRPCVDEPVCANGCRQWNAMTLMERSEGNLAVLVLNFQFVLETGSLPPLLKPGWMGCGLEHVLSPRPSLGIGAGIIDPCVTTFIFYVGSRI